MSDIFRKLLDCYSGKGGIHCYCCNNTKNSRDKRAKKKLRKKVRSKMKRDFKRDSMNDGY